jgi:hypothetical protein
MCAPWPNRSSQDRFAAATICSVAAHEPGSGNRGGLTVPLLTDELLDVADRAEGRLRGNAYLALKNVTCDFREGVLTLRGCLPSYYLKQIAQTTVFGLEGVRRIDNQIEVVSPGRGTTHSMTVS